MISKRRVLVKLTGSGENGEKETGDSAKGVSEEFGDEVIARGGSRTKRKRINAHTQERLYTNVLRTGQLKTRTKNLNTGGK